MWSLQDAKNPFSAVVKAALAGTPQEVSRRGKPAVVVLSVADYRRLLAEARDAGLILAVATTTTPDNVTALLRHSLAEDGPDWFALIAAGDIVPAKKPAPDIYVWALEKLGLAPEECLAFEDSRNGIRASLGAGLRTLVTVNDYTRDDDFSGALAVLSDLGEPDAPFQRLDEAGETGLVDLAKLRSWLG